MLNDQGAHVRDAHVGCESILLQKFEIVSRRFFREKREQAAIIDGCGVKFVSQVASEYHHAMSSLTCLLENRAYSPENF
jgi:hypothetical protein